MLEREVRFGNEVDYQNWTADKTPDSLLVLGKWFSQNVATMERPEEEKKAKAEELARLSDKLRPMYEVPDWVLTERTFSLITDIGMYLGETFQANYSVIKWDLFIKTKLWADHQWPVLRGFGRTDICNPLGLVHVLALGLVDGTRKAGGLHELYNIWVHHIDDNQPKTENIE